MNVVLVNLSFLLVGVLVVELGFGWWWQEPGLRRLNIPLGVSQEFDVCDKYPRDPCQIRYIRDQNGLRQPYKALDQIDILLVGGSTTDQRFLDETETFGAHLMKLGHEQGIPITVVNGGVDGQSTVGHLANFEWWYPHLENFSPRYILFYIGINDLYVTQKQRPLDRLKANSSTWKDRSALVHMFRTVRGMIKAQQTGVAHGIHRTDQGFITEPMIKGPGGYDEFLKDKTEGLYIRTRELIRRTREIGAVPIIVTQRHFVQKETDGQIKALKGDLTINGQPFNLMDVYNMQMIMKEFALKACGENPENICIDLAGEIEGLQQSDFYDGAHHTPSGAAKIGRFLADHLLHQL